MEAQNTQAKEKIGKLLKIALAYYGKEISLPSTQLFTFDQINDEENSIEGKYNYHIQYGFPQSGCVSMKFSYLEENNSFSINKISVYAPTADKEFVVTNFAPQSDFGAISVSANFGLDMDTKEHTSSVEIEQNPNALKMLDMAINDLSQAEILGECRAEVPIGSDRIPLCNTTNKPLNKGKR